MIGVRSLMSHFLPHVAVMAIVAVQALKLVLRSARRAGYSHHERRRLHLYGSITALAAALVANSY